MSSPPNPVVAAAIAATAPTPAGFSAKDLPPELHHTGHNAADKLVKKGQLIKAHGGARKVRFFTDAAMAAAYLAACAEQRRLDKAEAATKASATRKRRRAGPAKIRTKPAKPDKPKNPALPPAAQALPTPKAPKPSPPRSMFTTLKPVKQVEIIYPPGVKKTVQLLPDRYAVSVPRQKIGTPSWVVL